MPAGAAGGRNGMKIYVSSTFEDLRAHRAALDTALRRMGHEVIGMEHYVAEGSTPLGRCLTDVKTADIYIVIVAWRYGFIPTAANPACKSITELEYEAAVDSGRSILAFLLDPTEPWPPNQMDAFLESGGSAVTRFRSSLSTKHLAGIFRTADNLASIAAPAVAISGITQHMADRALKQDQSTADMIPFSSGEELTVTSLLGIRRMVASAGPRRAFVVQMGDGNIWWSTRLYLFATLLQTLTGVRQLVFANTDGAFAGMASPAAVRDGLCAGFPNLAAFDAGLRTEGGTEDSEREMMRCINRWNAEIRPKESDLKVGVRWPLVIRWLGERLITRCISIDAEADLTMVQVQQIVESLIPDVPIQRTQKQESSGDGAPTPAPPTPPLPRFRN